MNNKYLNSARIFFKKITRDPYTDWGIVISICLFGVIVLGFVSYLKYKEVTNEKAVDYVASTTKITIDIQKLNSIVEIYDNKKVIFDKVTLPKIDVRDPSL